VEKIIAGEMRGMFPTRMGMNRQRSPHPLSKFIRPLHFIKSSRVEVSGNNVLNTPPTIATQRG
jgi:hypothetical protein